MSHDFKQKEPTKTEKILYELMMRQEMMDRNLMTNSALLCAIAMEKGISPQKLAEILIKDNEKIKEYSKALNEEIGKLEKEKHAGHEQGPGDSGVHNQA
jgi:hypothetical protein